MKKALSLALALILALTMALPAFAAVDEKSLSLGEPTTISVKDGDEIKATFIPEENGIFTLEYELLEGDDEYAPSYELEFESIYIPDYATDGDETYEDEGTDVFLGKKGESYTITFYGDCGDYTVNAEISEYDCLSLNEGKNTVNFKEYDESVFATFVPENDGYYNFASDCGKDVGFAITDADDLWAFNDDNGYENDTNFDCTVYLEAGKMYLIKFDDYFALEAEAFDCDVTVTYGKTKKAEAILLDGLYLYHKYDTGCIYSYIIPSGAAATAEVTIRSSNEEIIVIDEYDETYGEIYVSSLGKPGKAVITVTADGVSEDFKIKVCNDFEWFFVTLWHNFNNFLSRVFHFRFA